MEESVDRLSIFENWLVGEGVAVGIAAMMATAAGVLVVVILAMIANLVAKRVLLRAVVTLAEHTETSWDDVLIERRVFHRLAHVAPALVLYFWFLTQMCARSSPRQVGHCSGKTLRMCSCPVRNGAVVGRSIDGRLRGPRSWWGACSAAA